MSMSDAPELFPCPFCGGRGQEKWAHDGKAFNWVECAGCGAKGPWAKVGHDGSGARNWNARASRLAALEAEVGRLREFVDAAYKEGYSDGYHTSNPHKDIASDWQKSSARAALATQEPPHEHE